MSDYFKPRTLAKAHERIRELRDNIKVQGAQIISLEAEYKVRLERQRAAEGQAAQERRERQDGANKLAGIKSVLRLLGKDE